MGGLHYKCKRGSKIKEPMKQGKGQIGTIYPEFNLNLLGNIEKELEMKEE